MGDHRTAEQMREDSKIESLDSISGRLADIDESLERIADALEALVLEMKKRGPT